MKTKLLTTFVFFILVCAYLRANPLVETLDLNRALEIAVKNSSELLVAEQNLTIAQMRVKEASFRFFPQIGFSGTITKSELDYPIVLNEAFANHYLAPSPYENFYTFKTSIIQTLYSGGKIRNTLRLAKAGLKQAETEYEKTKREVELNLKKAFFELLYSKKLLESAKEWQKKIELLHKKASLNAWQKIQAEKIKQEIFFYLQSAEKEITQKKLHLIKALNKELDGNIDIKGGFEPDIARLELDKAIFWAMELRAELKSQVYKAEMDSISLNLAMSRKAPTVSLGAVYDVVGNKFPLDKNNWYTTLAIQFPLSLDLWTQIKQRRAEIRQGELKRASLQDEVKLQVRCTYDDLIFWQKKVSEIEDFYLKLESSFEKTAASQTVTMDALKSAMDVYKTKTEYLQTIKNQLIGLAQMEWVLGCKLPCQR